MGACDKCICGGQLLACRDREAELTLAISEAITNLRNWSNGRKAVNIFDIAEELGRYIEPREAASNVNI